VYWVHRARVAAACFHAARARSPLDRPPTCDRWLPPSTFVSPLQSSFVPCSARPFRGGRACQGFCPPRDITGARPLTARHPRPRYVPSSGVRSLSTVCSALRLRGLFHPRAASRAHPVQGLLSPRSATASSAVDCLLAVTASCARRSLRDRRPPTSRLGLEASIRAEARARGSGDQPSPRSLPSSVSCSSRRTTPRPRI
jgi:hypothetical protein